MPRMGKFPGLGYLALYAHTIHKRPKSVTSTEKQKARHAKYVGVMEWKIEKKKIRDAPLQSFSNTTPNMCSSAFSTGTRSKCSVGTPTKNASSSSTSSSFVGAGTDPVVRDVLEWSPDAQGI